MRDRLTPALLSLVPLPAGRGASLWGEGHDYRKDKSWQTYVERFERLMDERSVPASLDRALFEHGPVCLLCSENKPDRCHRRLVAERLADVWGDVEIRHLI